MRHNPRRERGAALVMVMTFAMIAVAGVVLFLERSHVEIRESRLKAASVKNLFHVHSALSRAHKEINYQATQSDGPNQNVALINPEIRDGKAYIANTNGTVEVRSVKPSDLFDMDGNEIPPAGGYEALPVGWYVLEARVVEPMHAMADGSKTGALKLVRQYVRDGTPLSDNFVLVTDDDVGLGGAPVNPGKPAEGHIHTNGHMYIMTPNPYYANPMSSSDGMSYIAGATEVDTVFLNPDNDWDADEVRLPLPEDLVVDPDGGDDYLKAHALGSSPASLDLDSIDFSSGSGTASGGYQYDAGGITNISELRTSGTDPMPAIHVNTDADGVCRGVTIEGYLESEISLDGDTLSVTLWKKGAPGQWVEIDDIPMPRDGVVFVDNRSAAGDIDARTALSGELSTRTTLATTGNVDIVDSISYVDDDGDRATKFVHNDDLDGVDPADYGTVSDIGDVSSFDDSAEVVYMANKRPPGVAEQSGDGFYDGDAVLGVVASQDILILSDVPQNAEIAGSYLSLEQRLTLEGMGYNSSGNLSYVDSSNDFYTSNGARNSIRRFGGLITKRRPATAVVNGSSGSFLYGFKRGFSLFDEDMKQHPPPFFPKNKKPQYLGWELKDLGVRPIN